jgi:hypothetical protein
MAALSKFYMFANLNYSGMNLYFVSGTVLAHYVVNLLVRDLRDCWPHPVTAFVLYLALANPLDETRTFHPFIQLEGRFQLTLIYTRIGCLIGHASWCWHDPHRRQCGQALQKVHYLGRIGHPSCFCLNHALSSAGGECGVIVGRDHVSKFSKDRTAQGTVRVSAQYDLQPDGPTRGLVFPAI